MRVISRTRAVGAVRTWTGDIANQPRLLLAAKTALAAAIAWYLAPYVPFADAEYSYYAPLGVLLSMYPTLADSARSGLQTVIGLAIGISLGLGGLALVGAGAPGIAAVAVVIAVGVLLGGIRALGAGRELVAVAGLFVLLLGGRDADGFSVSYLVTMAFGVLVGVVVNLAVFPPLYLKRASVRLSALRDAAAAELDEMADAVERSEIDADELDRRMDELAAAVAAASAEVREAAASKRGNPRGRRRDAEQTENADRLRALERTVFFIRDLADVLARPVQEPSTSDPHVAAQLAEAIRRCRDLVREPVGSPEAAPKLRAATTALDTLTRTVDDRPDERPSGVAEALTAVVCLRRIVDASRPFV